MPAWGTRTTSQTSNLWGRWSADWTSDLRSRYAVKGRAQEAPQWGKKSMIARLTYWALPSFNTRINLPWNRGEWGRGAFPTALGHRRLPLLRLCSSVWADLLSRLSRSSVPYDVSGRGAAEQTAFCLLRRPRKEETPLLHLCLKHGREKEKQCPYLTQTFYWFWAKNWSRHHPHQKQVAVELTGTRGAAAVSRCDPLSSESPQPPLFPLPRAALWFSSYLSPPPREELWTTEEQNNLLGNRKSK